MTYLILLLIPLALISFQSDSKGSEVIWPAIESEAKFDLSIEKKVQGILSRMTLEEKVSQMIQAEIKSVTPTDIKTFKLGSILNGGGSFPNNNKYSKASDWVALADSYYKASIMNKDEDKSIPIIWGTDAVHGHNNVIGATIFPHNIGLGAANNPKLIESIASATTKEVLVTGIDWVFAPTVAVVENDRWGRTYESYSEKPEIVASMARAFVRGMQGYGDTLFDQDHLLSTVKHFVGDGGTQNGVDQGNNLSSEEKLLNTHAQGYYSALKAGAQTVMASFNSWHGEKLHGNKYLLTEVLKNQMGFEGFVIGDWNGHGQVVGCTNSSCPQAINAGVDMIMVPNDWKAFYYNTLGQVKSGEIKLSRVDDAVTRILRVKMRAGLFNYVLPSDKKHAGDDSIFANPEHKKIARQAVSESLVLLKNKNKLLPLPANSNILVTGAGANNIGQQSGGWTLSWQGTGNTNRDFPTGTSIYQGIADAISLGKGTVALSKDGKFKTKPDVAIVVFGETPYAEGQGDRQHLFYRDLYTNDLELLKKFKVEGIPTVSIFLTGRPMWVNEEINASDAFVVAWLPGSEGAGVADVLITKPSGKKNKDFKGRLSFSWPNYANQIALSGLLSNDKPAFSYGYGLTYNDVVSSEALPEVPFPFGEYTSSKEEILVFSGRTLQPFRSYVGDNVDARQVLDGGVGVSSDKSIRVKAVDKDIQEDAREVSFLSPNFSKYFFRSESIVNIQSYLDLNGALDFDIRVDSKPSSSVTLSLGKAQGSIESFLVSQENKKWTKVSIPLSCFSDRGADLKSLSTPFSIETKGDLTISLANIKISSKPSANVSSVQDCSFLK